MSEISNNAFKQTEIGLVPLDWEVRSIGECFDIQQGKALNNRARKGKSLYPFLRTSNVFWGRIDLNKLDQMSFTEKEIKKLRLLPGDLLVCEGGDIGRTAIWEGQIDYCMFQNHLHRLRPRYPNVEPLFLIYWMQSAFTQLGLYSGQGNITTIPNLSRQRLSTFLFPLPSLAEQRAIAYVLRTVQRAKEATEKVIAAARQLKQSLMRHLFTYGPVSFHETDQVEVKETEIGLTMPSKWQLVKVNDLTIKMFGGGTPSTFRPEFWNGGQPWTTSAVIKDDDIYLIEYKRCITKDGLMKSSTKIVPKGGILIGTRVGVGKCAVASFNIAISQDLTGIILKPIILPEFFVISMKLPSFQNWFEENKRGATIKGVTRIDIGSLKIPLPSLDEQRYIVDILLKIHNFIEKEEKRVKALEILFQSFLYSLMTGQIRVHDLGFPVTEEAV